MFLKDVDDEAVYCFVLFDILLPNLMMCVTGITHNHFFKMKPKVKQTQMSASRTLCGFSLIRTLCVMNYGNTFFNGKQFANPFWNGIHISRFAVA